MKKPPKMPGCGTCTALDQNCGGHWSRAVRPRTLATAGRPNLDTYDDVPDRDANYHPDQEDAE